MEGDYLFIIPSHGTGVVHTVLILSLSTTVTLHDNWRFRKASAEEWL